jgi:hypothetical protein
MILVLLLVFFCLENIEVFGVVVLLFLLSFQYVWVQEAESV